MLSLLWEQTPHQPREYAHRRQRISPKRAYCADRLLMW
jgi:hypothetical protein